MSHCVDQKATITVCLRCISREMDGKKNVVQQLLEHLLSCSKRNKLDLHGLEGLTNLMLKNKVIDVK